MLSIEYTSCVVLDQSLNVAACLLLCGMKESLQLKKFSDSGRNWF